MFLTRPRASKPIQQFQEQPPANSTEDWRDRTGTGRAQVCRPLFGRIGLPLCFRACVPAAFFSPQWEGRFRQCFLQSRTPSFPQDTNLRSLRGKPHRLVLDTLAPLDGKRKCFRLTNGVLVERTVEDVVPSLKTNSEGLRNVLDDLVKTYKGKEAELDKWKACLFSLFFRFSSLVHPPFPPGPQRPR